MRYGRLCRSGVCRYRLSAHSDSERLRARRRRTDISRSLYSAPPLRNRRRRVRRAPRRLPDRLRHLGSLLSDRQGCLRGTFLEQKPTDRLHEKPGSSPARRDIMHRRLLSLRGSAVRQFRITAGGHARISHPGCRELCAFHRRRAFRRQDGIKINA